MEIRLLVTFEKVAAVLSFTQAAAELKYAQSSVTSQIRALESSLGVQLFDRLGSHIRLTEAGDRLLPYARQIIELSEEARAAVVGTEEPSGTLTVGTMESLTSYRLSPLLELFHHRYPGVRLSMRPTLGDETRQALRQGTYDVGFLMERETEHAGLEVTLLAEEPLALVAAPGHPLAGAAVSAVSTADLVREPLLATEPGCAYRDLFEEELNTRSAEPVSFMEFGTIEATKRAAAAGLGIALLPAVTVAEELADGRLVALPWEPPFTLRTQLAWRSGKRLPAHARLFVEQARKLVAEQG
ncbi:LysR family transcriptional regulator [Streptomyces phaeochromogenes]|uniref:LysR family transcriptional regulator n=1 Tax=Streptomyces phaeochromogenes TaxID=1923 RepID=UPI00225BCDBB|nr:LysR family transcriptional regulator [Streptomyces phaeochromogenes]MCX5604481.1 LysR family transcriptional regulator [Streptomyces phaeochromogenes]WSW15393.1 LysR family transcriptional regulator [Streptomyces phaeochromogenes]